MEEHVTDQPHVYAHRNTGTPHREIFNLVFVKKIFLLGEEIVLIGMVIGIFGIFYVSVIRIFGGLRGISRTSYR